MNNLCKPRGGFCCILAYTPHKPWTPKLWLQPSALQRICRQRLLCVAAKSSNSHHAYHDTSRPWASSIGETIKEVNHGRHLQIVLFSPQIAGNTGSIARTCAAASVGLHLIEPLGFQIDDTKLKRAGLDYWPFVFVKVHASWKDFMNFFKQQEGEKRLIAFTKRGTCLYTEKQYKAGDWLVFGSETSGLTAEALEDCADESNYGGGKVRIPMLDTYVRSLNLSVSVGIGVYEALRQLKVLRNLFDETNDSLLEDYSEEVDRERILSAVE